MCSYPPLLWSILATVANIRYFPHIFVLRKLLLLNCSRIEIIFPNFCKTFQHFLICSIPTNPQQNQLVRNIEMMAFRAAGHEKLYFAREELLSQVKNLSISINSKGLFNIDRPFFSTVSENVSFFGQNILNKVEGMWKFKNCFSRSRWLLPVPHTSSFSFNSTYLNNELLCIFLFF